MKNIYVDVETSMIFKGIKFKFKEALTLLGIREDGKLVSLFILGVKVKLFDLKVFVD